MQCSSSAWHFISNKLSLEAIEIYNYTFAGLLMLLKLMNKVKVVDNIDMEITAYEIAGNLEWSTEFSAEYLSRARSENH